MAWTAPRTYVSTEVITASILNTDLRDNLLETAPAKATADSGFIVTTAANTVIQRTPQTATITTSETTASTSYTDLATTGPNITATTGTKVLISMVVQLGNNTLGGRCHVSFAVTGASSISAVDITAVMLESDPANQAARIGVTQILDTLTGGSNTVTMKYRVGAGTGTFLNRKLSVIPFG